MIKLFLVDCDATLTDGIYHTTEMGVISKNFYTRDFHGMWMLNEAGVQVGIVTVSRDTVIKAQCDQAAKYATVLRGAKDKLKTIEGLYVDPGAQVEVPLSWDEIAYIADDVFDIPLLAAVGLCACPYDSDESVSRTVLENEGFESKFDGGKGCVREFADYVLDINRSTQ